MLVPEMAGQRSFGTQYQTDDLRKPKEGLIVEHGARQFYAQSTMRAARELIVISPTDMTGSSETPPHQI